MTDIIEIPPMSIQIIKTLQIARITSQIYIPRIRIDIRTRHRDIIASPNVILRADMPEAERQRGKPRNRIIVMRNAIVATFILVGDIVADLAPPNARLAICI